MKQKVLEGMSGFTKTNQMLAISSVALKRGNLKVEEEKYDDITGEILYQIEESSDEEKF